MPCLGARVPLTDKSSSAAGPAASAGCASKRKRASIWLPRDELPKPECAGEPVGLPSPAYAESESGGASGVACVGVHAGGSAVVEVLVGASVLEAEGGEPVVLDRRCADAETNEPLIAVPACVAQPLEVCARQPFIQFIKQVVVHEQIEDR